MNEGYSSQLTPTVGTAGYIPGDGVGGILNFGSICGLAGKRYSINSIDIQDKSKSHPALFIEFFMATPAAGTYTDSSPLVYGSGDRANSVGVVSILAGDWIDLPRVSATYSTVSINDLNIIVNSSGTNLFGLIHSDSTFSLTAGDLVISIAGTQL